MAFVTGQPKRPGTAGHLNGMTIESDNKPWSKKWIRQSHRMHTAEAGKNRPKNLVFCRQRSARYSAGLSMEEKTASARPFAK